MSHHVNVLCYMLNGIKGQPTYLVSQSMRRFTFQQKAGRHHFFMTGQRKTIMLNTTATLISVSLE